MTRLAAGKQINLHGYWNGVDKKLVQQFCTDFEYEYVQLDTLHAALYPDTNTLFIAIHPLWGTTYTHLILELQIAIDTAVARGHDVAYQIRFVDLFELSRRPEQVDADIFNNHKNGSVRYLNTA